MDDSTSNGDDVNEIVVDDEENYGDGGGDDELHPLVGVRAPTSATNTSHIRPLSFFGDVINLDDEDEGLSDA